MNAVLQIWLQQGRVGGEEKLPGAIGHILFNALPSWTQGHTAGSWSTRYSSAGLLSSKSAPSLYWCMGLLLHRCRTLTLVELHNASLAISAACQVPSEWQSSPLVYLPLHSIWYNQYTCWGCIQCLHSGHWWVSLTRQVPVLIPGERYQIQASNQTQ